MNEFTIEIASVPDRENLVAEIWHKNIMIAEINQERNVLEIELFQSDRLNFTFDEYMDALALAKKKLIGADAI